MSPYSKDAKQTRERPRRSRVLLEYLYNPSCPSWEEGLTRLLEVLEEEGLKDHVEVRRVLVPDEETAARLRFPGTPTYRAQGEDLFGDTPRERGDHEACRAYITPEGRVSPIPSRAMLKGAIRSRLRLAVQDPRESQGREKEVTWPE